MGKMLIRIEFLVVLFLLNQDEQIYGEELVECENIQWTVHNITTKYKGIIDSPNAFSWIDLDNDGDYDISISSQDGKIAWIENYGNYIFSKPRIIETDMPMWNRVLAIDLNNDTLPEICGISKTDRKLIVYENNIPVNNFTTTYTLENNQDLYYLINTDLNQDGFIDLLGFSNDCDTIWYKNVNNDLSSFVSSILNSQICWPNMAIVIDANDDNFLDIITVDEFDHYITILYNNGDEVFTRFIAYDGGTSCYSPIWIVPTNIITNMFLDLVLACFDSNTIYVLSLQNSADTTFEISLTIDTAIDAVTCVDVADINHDGLIDIGATSLDLDSVKWYRNNGDDTFSEPIISNKEIEALESFFVDFDSDSDYDLLSGARGWPALRIFEYDCLNPTSLPTSVPSSQPRSIPTSIPTLLPMSSPTAISTPAPTSGPTNTPTSVPTNAPTTIPSKIPISNPTAQPSTSPSAVPTSGSTTLPTGNPTLIPTGPPTSAPTTPPTEMPTACPTGAPTFIPTDIPTSAPTSRPTNIPTALPTIVPTTEPTPCVQELQSGEAEGLEDVEEDQANALMFDIQNIGTEDIVLQRISIPIVPGDPGNKAKLAIWITDQPYDGVKTEENEWVQNSIFGYGSGGYSNNQPMNDQSFNLQFDEFTEFEFATPIKIIAGQTMGLYLLTGSETGFGSGDRDVLGVGEACSFDDSVANDLLLKIKCGIASEDNDVWQRFEESDPTRSAIPIVQLEYTLAFCAPTPEPTSLPTAAPSSEPTMSPTSVPTASPIPTSAPTSIPTSVPTAVPTVIPTSSPTGTPTFMPSATSTNVPPTITPTSSPSSFPTTIPSSMPTSYPTVKPSSPPSEIPTSLPTGVPIFVPTSYPTATPISIPSAVPTSLPSSFPTPFPTTHVPSSSRPTLTSFPTTFNPSLSPTAQGSSSIPSAPPTLSGESIVMGSFLLEGDMTASDVEENKDVFEYAIASSVGVDASTVDISVDEVRRRRLTSLEVTYIIRPSSSKVDSIMTALLTVESNDLETALITAQDAVGATIDMSLISIESMTTPVRMDTDYPSLLPTLLPCQNIDTIIEAPILKQAAFDKTGASLVLTFDVATDRASYLVGAEFPCSKVFDFTDAASSSCFWTTNQHLIADVSALTSLYPGDNVSLASDNTVKNECEDWIEQRCDCFASASSNYTITIELPSKILSPKVVLEGSSVANACEGLAIDSSASTGSGGREFIDYAWNVSAVAINASAARKVIATILSDAVQRQQGAYQFLLSSDEVTALYASSVEKVHVQLQITNFLGGTASADFTVTLSAETPPFLEVIGGLQQTARRPDPLSIRANAVATSCDGRPAISRGVELDWIFLARDESITNVGLSSTSSDPRLFQLPAYSLIAGASYLLEVTAIDKTINQTSQASCEVIVEHSSIVAVLNGGSDRIASLSEIITISAAASIDLDVETERGSAAGLSFEWNCSALQNTSNCSTFAIALNDDKWYQRESLIFNGSALGLGLFKFHVTVFSNNGRSDITSTLLKIVDDSPPIVEIVDFASSIVSVDSRLVVYSTSTPSSDFLTLATLHSSENVIFNTSWSLQSGSLAQGLKLEDWTTTKTFISAPTSVLSSNNEYQREHNLVLKSGSLVPGSYYTLRLEARLDGISTPGYAAISFKAAAAPSGGILEIKPAAGIALETLFTLTTRNWASDAFPLKYAFKVIDSEGVLSTLRTATSDLRLKDAILPAGTPNVTVQVIVYDSIGSMATQSRSVRCAQLDDLDALVNATQILLANMIALNSNEGIYQIVVAATHADATKSISGLSSVLTDAIATVVASQDADIELVEQAAVAIEEVFARSEFETATATTTLNIFQTLAETSAEIGITSISAETIGLGLSMMLDTPILGKNDSNMSAKFDASLAALMKAQRLNLLPDEDAILITTKNLRTAAARLEASSADSEERQVSCLDSETAVILPESLPGDDSYDISLVEFSVSPHSSIDTTTDTNVGVIRFSMEASSTSGRRMLEDSSATAQVDVLFGPTIAQHANALTSIPYATNVSCPCDYVGNVSVKCPSGAVVTRMCSGEPGTYNITCPRTLTSCLVWEDSLEKWGNAACSLSPSANGNKVSCSCSVTFGSTSDFGVSNAVLKSYAAYAANITQGVDPEKALYMFICIGLVLLLCFFLAWYGAQLDKKDAAMVADNPKPFISIRGQVTTVHGRHHIESRSHKDLARTGAKTEKIDTHPLFINERSRMRYVAALAHQHPLASWYFCYSPSASRVIRVIALGFELFFFMFVLACEVNLIYADPGCSKQTNRKDCLAFKKAFWAGGSDMCSWRNCKCQPDTPAFTTAATNPHHYLVLAIVLLLTFPVLRGFEYVFRHYLIAPLPPELKRLVRWYMGQRAQHAVHIDESEIKTVKNSNENDDDDERETEIVDMAAKRHQNHVQGTFWIARIVGRWRLRHLRQQKVKHTRRQSLRRVSNFVEKYVTNAEKRQEARLEVKERFQAYVNSVSRNSQPELSKAQRFWKLIRCDNWHKSKIEQNPGDIKLSPEAILSARQAKRLAPIAAMHVLSQLEELHAHLVHYFCQGEAKEFEVSVISKLAMHMQKQWDWLDEFDEWLFNVEDKLFDDLMTAHKWRDELLTLKTTFTDSNEMNRAIKRKLHELERVSRMSRSERIVWNSCMSRTEFIVVAPEDSPSLTSYILAWSGVGCLTIGMLYFLLSTSSELGKKQSALWLSHIAITGALTYLFIFPIEIYLFYVTIPNLLWDRIMTRTPGTLKKFPFMSPQPPYALRFLLELEPSLASTQDAAKIVYGTAVRSQLRDVPLSISNEDLRATELAEILEYETWTPSPDTLFLLTFIGMYAALPEYFQQVIFEELLSLTPYMSAILTKRTIFASTKLPRRLVAAVVIVVTIFLVFLSYGAFELARMIIRTRVRQIHNSKWKRSRIRDGSDIVDEDEAEVISDGQQRSFSTIPSPLEEE